jgi:hypothetical protein
VNSAIRRISHSLKLKEILMPLNTTSNQHQQFFRVDEAANFLRIKRTRFDIFVKDFNIPVCSHGGQVRIYDRKDLLKAVEASKRVAAPKPPEPTYDYQAEARALLGAE